MQCKSTKSKSFPRPITLSQSTMQILSKSAAAQYALKHNTNFFAEQKKYIVIINILLKRIKHPDFFICSFFNH